MNDAPLHPMTLHQFACRWQVSERTARKWIQPLMAELGTIHGNIFTPRQVKIILEHLE